MSPGSIGSVTEDCDTWGVMWVSGRAAMEMEACTDAQVSCSWLLKCAPERAQHPLRSHTRALHKPAGDDACMRNFNVRAQAHEGIRHILDAFPAIKLPKGFSVLRTRWGSDLLHRGSYSYISADASTSDVETLSQPLVGRTFSS